MNPQLIYWHTQSSENIPETLDWLHPSEARILQGYRFEKKRNDWLLGRWTAKNAIRKYLAKEYPLLTLKDIEVRRAEDGAPEPMLNGKLLPIYVSLSHSHDIGFCTISEESIIHGCDVEYIEPRSDAFISDYLTGEERNILARNTDDVKPLIANILWSTKESTMKLMRTGLSIDTRKVMIQSIDHGSHMNWNHIKIVFEPENKEYSGNWKSEDNFIYTIVTEVRKTELIEMLL